MHSNRDKTLFPPRLVWSYPKWWLVRSSMNFLRDNDSLILSCNRCNQVWQLHRSWYFSFRCRCYFSPIVIIDVWWLWNKPIEGPFLLCLQTTSSRRIGHGNRSLRGMGGNEFSVALVALVSVGSGCGRHILLWPSRHRAAIFEMRARRALSTEDTGFYRCPWGIQVRHSALFLVPWWPPTCSWPAIGKVHTGSSQERHWSVFIFGGLWKVWERVWYWDSLALGIVKIRWVLFQTDWSIVVDCIWWVMAPF
jgi:hypothetical protein